MFPPATMRPYDLLIDELMIDPSPSVGLPANEWIEIKNTTNEALDLQDCRIGYNQMQTGPLPAFVLLPGITVILCASSAVNAMAAFGPALAVPAFPSMDNRGGTIFLVSAQHQIIHSISYSDGWYKNELKKNGGWTLEMIDTKNPCGGDYNWTASRDIKGGSPGRPNSVDASNPDDNAPRLLRAYATDSLNLALVFDESLDSLHSAVETGFRVSDGIGIPQSALLMPPSFTRVHLKLTNRLLRGKIYTVTCSNVADCSGNPIGSSSARLGLSEPGGTSDIIINEVLFNPPPGDADYVEVYNRGERIANLEEVYIAGRNRAGALEGIVPLSTESLLLFPGDFMVITSNPSLVKQQYITLNKDAFVEVETMPSMGDARGTVVLLNRQGEIIDELTYDEKWHFPLIDDPQGVALERIDYNAPTQSGDNWHSAATSSGFGTPTSRNSQYLGGQPAGQEIVLSPGIVSPDNDGQDDYATIDYTLPAPGYLMNITFFDASGKPVRYLQRNALCGLKGSFRWDGLGEKNQQLATGIYVMSTEVFNLKGARSRYKHTIVVARRG